MAGIKEGGQKSTETQKQKDGEDTFKNRGAEGGKNSQSGGRQGSHGNEEEEEE